MRPNNQPLPSGPESGHGRGMRWFFYWWRVLVRSWTDAWVMIVGRSIWAILRSALFLGISGAGLLVLRRPLSQMPIPWSASASVTDVVVWLVAGMLSISAVFSALFVFLSIFVTPYQLWKAERDTVTALEAAGPYDPAYVRDAKSFELWEAACLIGGVPFQNPVPAGDAFLALEQIQRAVRAGTLKAIISKAQRQRLEIDRAVAEVSGSEPPRLDDHTKMTRAEFVDYLKRIGRVVPGLDT